MTHTLTHAHTCFHSHLHLYSDPGNSEYFILSVNLHHQLISLLLLSIERHTGGDHDSAGRPDDEESTGVKEGVFQRFIETVAHRVHNGH